jgi:heat-inducible transcriptional repressor
LRVLAVVVMTSGLVRDRALTLDTDLDLAALESAAAFLNQNFRGFTIQAIRDELAILLETARSDYQRTLASVNQLWQKTMPADTAAPRQTVYVEGVANLLGSEADRRRLHGMMAALEEKQRIVDLLTAYVDTRQESVRVVFDLEEHAPEMRDLVLIAAPARLAGESHGAVGVIGPKRMHYERAMSAVSYISQLFDRMLQPPL